MRALLVLNEQSRLGRRDGTLVCRTIEDGGVECVRDPCAAGVEAVIAAGGDGTLVGAIPLALERGVPLGIVPLGTFNDLARTLGVPIDVQSACAVILRARTRQIDVGCVNGVYFVNEASVGVSTRIARKQTPQVKQRFGALAILSTTVQTLREIRPFSVELAYGETVERFHTLQLTIANSARFGGVIQRADAAIDDGWLDLYSIEPRNWLNAFSLVRKIVRQDPSSGEGLRTRRAAEFHVNTRHAHHIAADGEPAGMTPATFRVLPKALSVFVP